MGTWETDDPWISKEPRIREYIRRAKFYAEFVKDYIEPLILGPHDEREHMES